MYRLVRQEYIDMMNSNRGVLSARIVIGSTVIESEQIYSVTCESAACPEKLSVGNFVMPKLTASISKEVSLPLVTSGLKIAFYVGMSADGTDFEYALVCSAQVASVTQKGQLYEISAHSSISNRINQLYSSELTFPQSSHSVLQEIGNYIGVKIDCEGVSDFTIDTQPSGYSCREIIASVAEKSGVNAFASRDDSTIIFKWFEDTNTVISSDCLKEPSLAVEPVRYRGVTCTNGSELFVHGEEPFLPLSNTAKLIAQSDDLIQILNSVSNVTFHPGSISMLLGNILYDPWDIVTIAVDGNTVMLPVCNLSHKYDGGLTTEIRIPEQEKVSSDGSSSSKTTAERAVDRLTAELFSAKEIMADKASVNKLSANLAEFENATANSLQAQQAKISKLEAEKLNTNELSAQVANLGYATVDSLKAESARIDKLDTTKLEASSAEIKNLEAGVADINTLIFGSASGDVIQTEFANAVVAQLGDAQIKSAMIESVSAGKLTAGDIVTNNVRVVSEDGSLLIEDKTMQISDGNTMRVQIGKDALGDYSLYVWDAQGNLMFDALGVHEAGIKSGIIRDDMVSDTANISAGKLNIDSLFTAINEDGSNTLKASKVLLDENNQTLEVAFKSMDSKVTEVDNEVSSMGTQLQMVQGQISAKVWEQDITKAVDDVREDFEGEVETLSTSYSELNHTVGNINATVAKHTSDINSVSNCVAELELSVDSFKSEVSKTYTPQSEFNDAFDIHGTASGQSINVSDSAESLLEGLSIYGKTTQDGTPTPDAPIELVSVADKGTIGTVVCGKNLFKSKDKNITPSVSDGQDINTVIGISSDYIRVNTNHPYILSQNGATTRYWFGYDKNKTFLGYRAGVDSSEQLFKYFPDTAYVRIRLDGRSVTNPQVEIGTVPTAFEPYKEQSVTIAENLPLRGIPVTSGGNYTDDSGQQWICDEIDLVRGVHIQRVYEDTVAITYLGTLSTGLKYGVLNVTKKVKLPDVGIMAEAARVIKTTGVRTENDVYENNGNIVFIGSADDTLETMQNKFNGTKVLYVLEESVETPLTDEELKTAKTLMSYYPVTNVVNDANADMTLSYRRYNKAVEFATHSEMNSAIEQTADSITLSVDKKFENYSTTEQMNSAINLKADSITSTVSKTYTTKDEFNNLEIGGRNLFGGFGEEEIRLNDYQNKGSFRQFPNLTFDPAEYIGKSFTVSFWAKSPNGTTQLRVYNRNGNPRYFYFDTVLDTALGTEWKYYTYTFVNTDRGDTYTSSNKLEIYASDQMGVLVKKIKVEMGTRATDWTPAPEDMASKTEMNSAIEQSADMLRLSVEETTKAFDKRLASAEASIQVNADNITQKVSAEDYNGEKIASLINQSADEVSIDAPHIKLEGVVTANEGFKIDKDGSMEATAGTIGGWEIRETDLYGESEASPDGNKFYSITLSRAWNYNDAQPIIYVTHVEKHVETNPGGNTTVLDVERRVAISPSGDAYFYNISAKNLMRGTLEVVVSNATTIVTATIPTKFTPSETTQCVVSLRTVGSPSPRYINCWVNYFKSSETADPLFQVCMTCGGSAQTAVPAGTYYIDYIIADV